MSDQTTLDRVRTLVLPIVADLHLDLYDLEFRGGTLRVTIDTPPGSPGGVDLEQIALVTRLVSRDLDLWAYARGVPLDFSRPGKPTDNAFIEAFNSRFRAECLNQHWFMSLESARLTIEDCEDPTMRSVRTARSGKSPDNLL